MLIEGVPGIGKSSTSKAWCDRFPGLVRYVEIPSSSDDRSFYVAIAEPLGVAHGESYNTQQVKLRVEKTLRLSGIMLVLDEAQFLWPQVVTPRGIPARMQWVKTMFDAGTPIALVGLPDFTKWKEKYVKKTLWNGDQLDSRLNYPLRLPLSHSLDDFNKIAQALHPHGNPASWKILAGLGLMLSRQKPQDRQKPDPLPAKNARAIKSVMARASYFAGKTGRDRVTTDDIKAAIKIEFPDFTAAMREAKADSLAQSGSVEYGSTGERSRETTKHAGVLNADCNVLSKAFQEVQQSGAPLKNSRAEILRRRAAGRNLAVI